MSFGTGHLDDPQKVGGGERQGNYSIILSETNFEDNLKVGRFAKLDSDRLDNMDGSASPVIAGVVLRNVANPVEDDDVIDADLYDKVEYLRQGLVVVDAKTGETPSLFDRVYVSNAGDTNDGLATVTNTDEPVNAEFIHEVQTDVWLVYLNPAPGDIAAHTGDADGAHAASAISVLDSGGFTSNDEVEAVLQEMLPAVSGIAVIADPGDAGAIPVTRSGNCAITTAGAETRTIADPGSVGLRLVLSADSVTAGTATITVATAFNQTGNNTIALDADGETIALESVQVGSSPVWRVAANDGATLSTV